MTPPPLAESVSPCFNRFVRAMIDAWIANERVARAVEAGKAKTS